MAERFCPVEFTDLRCWDLWRHSDAEALGHVAERYPEILPPEEYALVRAHQDFVHGGPDLYRRFSQHIEHPAFTPDYCEWEWHALTENHRWNVVMGRFITPYLEEIKYKSHVRQFLDLGTWTGAHAVYLSNLSPIHSVFAREVVLDCREAIQWTIDDHGVNRMHVHIQMGDHLIPPLPRELDVVYSGEVMEHVPSVAEFIEAIQVACRPGAQVVFTTPIQSPDDHPTRVHVRHLEVDDLQELFGQQDRFKCYSLGSHHIFGWRISSTPIGAVNWTRKLAKWGIP